MQGYCVCRMRRGFCSVCLFKMVRLTRQRNDEAFTNDRADVEDFGDYSARRNRTGGRSVVYQARKNLNRIMALKVITARSLGDGST